MAGSLVLLVGAPPEAVATSTAAAGPEVFAHRGGAAEAPENTLGAFRRAIDRYGTNTWLELDVQLSADGELVVIHDHTLDRTTDCAGTVMSRTTAELAACDAADEWRDEGWSFEPVPAFADVLAEGLAAGWKLMPELKNIPGESNFDPSGERAARALVAAIAEAGFPADRLIVQSFFPTSLDWVELLAPHLDTALLTTSTLPVPGLPTGAGFLVAENIAYATVRAYEVSAPDHRSLDLSAATVAAAHAAGRRVVVWTADDEDRVAELAAMGVDGIITNRPGAALRSL